MVLIGLHGDVGIQRGEGLPARLDLWHADRLGAVQDLPLEIGEIDHVAVDEPDRADARRGQVEGRGRTQSAGADDQDLGLVQLLLPLAADIRQNDVPAVALYLGVGEIHMIRRWARG